MKMLVMFLLLMGSSILCFGQKQLLSYDDLKYLLTNNLQQADTFMVAKGYHITEKSNKSNNRKYAIAFAGSGHSEVGIRLDGKRLFIEIETNELSQYDMINNSIAQYIDKNSQSADVKSYSVKDLGVIYITVNDTAPYDPLKRDYDIHIVSDKHITAYN